MGITKVPKNLFFQPNIGKDRGCFVKERLCHGGDWKCGASNRQASSKPLGIQERKACAADNAFLTLNIEGPSQRDRLGEQSSRIDLQYVTPKGMRSDDCAKRRLQFHQECIALFHRQPCQPQVTEIQHYVQRKQSLWLLGAQKWA